MSKWEHTVEEKDTIFRGCEATKGRDNEEVYGTYDGRNYGKPFPRNYSVCKSNISGLNLQQPLYDATKSLTIVEYLHLTHIFE